MFVRMSNMTIRIILFVFGLSYVGASPIRSHSTSIDLNSPRISDLLDSSPTLTALVNNILQGNLSNLQTPEQVLNALLQAIRYPEPAPANISQVINAAAKASGAVTNSTPPNVLEYAVNLLLEGINPTSVQTDNDYFTTFSSMTNENPYLPNVIQHGDPPYSVNESILRAAMYFPTGFNLLNASNISAIIMVPGTGVPSGQSLAVSYEKKFTEDGMANPMWLNIPTNTLQDAQLSAEYVAYAINYVSVCTGGRNVSVIAWSQGTIDTQWALKYFNSTRKLVTDYIAISPDFRGTITASRDSSGPLPSSAAPSILQQAYNSTFIRTLRQNGGDSELVPTTTVYSATDEIVEPQSGPDASGLLFGASNNLIQELCPLQPAGSVYTHEGMLYNPLGYALAVDAITNVGHADFSRMLAKNSGICLLLTEPGLTLNDVLLLEYTQVTFALNMITFSPKQSNEPPIKSYATY